MTIIIGIGVALVALMVLINAWWALFPMVLAGAVWLLIKTAVETKLPQINFLFESYCGLASYIVLVGLLVWI